MGKANPASRIVDVVFVDSHTAPDVFADETSGFYVHNGVVRITLASARIDHGKQPGPVNRVVVARIVMPVPAAQALAINLFDFLKSRGLAPALLNEAGEPHKAN